MQEIPASLMRGGTSRGIVFRAEDLPSDEAERLAIFRYALGSPDPSGRQVDGLGGGNSSTSKAAVLWRSPDPDYDVYYSFYQVSVGSREVDTRGNCGNLTAAAAAFAVNEGWASTDEPSTEVRIFNTNTQKRIIAHVPTRHGRAQVEGRHVVHGVPHPGAPIRLSFVRPGGAVTGKLLPTGRAQEQLALPSGEVCRVSIVDAANPIVLVASEDLGVPATALPPMIESNHELLARLQAVRELAAVRIGLAATPEEAREKSVAVPFVGFVGHPVEHDLLGGEHLEAADASLVVRFLSVGSPHRALPLTAALCTAVASGIAGTLAQEARGASPTGTLVRLAHPSGILEVDACVVTDEGAWVAESATVTLTARTIMRGGVWVPGG
ncbi:MAG TPA: PrpF domain-containing protein [Trueperaceae bacterium]